MASGAISPHYEVERVRCRICGAASEIFDKALVLHNYDVGYFRCTACGFVQTETPYWLGEAYSSAISKLDTGALYRNLLNQRITTSVLKLLFPEVKSALDYGAGHGIFVRLMRDSGFDFRWYDLHAANNYARGFEHDEKNTYDFLTSFEVLEHLIDPMEDLTRMMSLSKNLLVSTELIANPAPKVSDWWYYAINSGQHISFYTLESLQLVAQKFGRTLLSCGSYHLFSAKPKSGTLFRIATGRRITRLLSLWRKRPSLMHSDFAMLSK